MDHLCFVFVFFLSTSACGNFDHELINWFPSLQMFQESNRLEDMHTSKKTALQRRHAREIENFEANADHMDDVGSSWKHRSISSISSVSSTSSGASRPGSVENNGTVVQKSDGRLSILRAWSPDPTLPSLGPASGWPQEPGLGAMRCHSVSCGFFGVSHQGTVSVTISVLDCTQSLSFLLVVEKLERARCAAAWETGVSEVRGRVRDWSERDARPCARLEWARCGAACETGVSEVRGRVRDWSERDARPCARLEWARCGAACETGVSEVDGDENGEEGRENIFFVLSPHSPRGCASRSLQSPVDEKRKGLYSRLEANTNH